MLDDGILTSKHSKTSKNLAMVLMGLSDFSDGYVTVVRKPNVTTHQMCSYNLKPVKIIPMKGKNKWNKVHLDQGRLW